MFALTAMKFIANKLNELSAMKRLFNPISLTFTLRQKQ